VTGPLDYLLANTLIPETSSCVVPRNNLTQRLKLGGSSQLHGEKGVEGNIFHNANTQKRK